MVPARKLSGTELTRAVRQAVAEEYEAVKFYTTMAESTNNKLAQSVLEDIVQEELVHVGEFLRLLQELSPDEPELYDQGAKEVEDAIKQK
jgi:rubrerythrin